LALRATARALLFILTAGAIRELVAELCVADAELRPRARECVRAATAGAATSCTATAARAGPGVVATADSTRTAWSGIAGHAAATSCTGAAHARSAVRRRIVAGCTSFARATARAATTDSTGAAGSGIAGDAAATSCTGATHARSAVRRRIVAGCT
jgi:hypothetical protein